MKLRAALYRRVSTEDQAREGLSLESQRERLLAFAASNEWQVVDEYEDDHTGLDTDRTNYKRMLDDVANWDVAVAIKGDRFHRSTDNAMAFWKAMRRAGKQIWTIAEGRLDTPENASKWFATMLTSAVLPEFESMQLSERVLPGMEKAKQKGLHTGVAPVGFIWVKKLARFEPTEWALKLRQDAERYGLRTAGQMNPYPAHFNKKAGRLVHPKAVKRVLVNLQLYDAKALAPNREQTPTGTHSKFRPKP